MANETIEEKIPEAESQLKQEDGVADSDKETEKKEAPVSDDKEKEKGQVDDEENQEENTGKKPVTPVGERPTRIRKKVEPYILPTLSRHSGSKPVSIEQGRGTRLKEIPNVAYKLAKRKPDDNLFLLHTILYGRKGKAQMLKRNIGQFSGFVWSEKEEEKQRAKAKEKLEKCIKEKLIDFCDVLDIPINKSNVKKEELAVRVLEFLVYPKATRDIVLADRQKEPKKRKKRTPQNLNSEESSDVQAKSRRQTKKSGKKLDQPSETEERNDEGDVGSEGTNDTHGEDDAALEKENEKNEDTETEDEKDKAEEKKSTDKKSSSKSTTKKEKPALEEEISVKGHAKSGRKSSKQVDKSTSSSSKKQKVDKDDSSKEKGKKETSKPQAKEKSSKKGKREPTRKEMQVVVAKILKEVDFNTATLSDILRKLGSHFGVDLMHRKTEVKDIITDAIDKMGDDDEERKD